MKMSFLPGDLHVFTDDQGYACLILKGERVGRFRSQKQAIQRFNELRSNLERQHPAMELSEADKQAAMQREIGDSLTAHNSLRNAGPKKRTGTRTFG